MTTIVHGSGNGDIKVLNAHPYYDIFQGEGWSGHTRLKRVRYEDNFVFKHISGQRLHPKFISDIMEAKP